MSTQTDEAAQNGRANTAEVVIREPAAPALAAPLMSNAEIEKTWRVASALARSRMFKDALQAEQAFAKILLGRDLGLSPTQAMTGIHIVEGKPELAAVTLASFVRRLPGIGYRVTEHSDDACEITFTEDDEVIGVSRFTAEDAERAGLHKPSRNGAPSNHTKYPRNMLWARAMSNGVKWYVPEALAGIPVYHEGEIDPDDDPVTSAIPAASMNGTAEGDPPDAEVIPDGPSDEQTDRATDLMERIQADLVRFGDDKDELDVFQRRLGNAYTAAGGTAETIDVAALAEFDAEAAGEFEQALWGEPTEAEHAD